MKDVHAKYCEWTFGGRRVINDSAGRRVLRDNIVSDLLLIES